ncbi:MAG: thaumatin family protein [Legionella sp.]|nr:thaumatin family protein [Legionella sp.]
MFSHPCAPIRLFTAAFVSMLWVLNASAVQTKMIRTITFKNFCAEPIWIAITPSYIPGNNKTCKVDNDCLRGASCKGYQCVYPISVPIGGVDRSPWKLAAYNVEFPDNPATQSTMDVNLQHSVPDPTKPDDIVYQYVANFGGRTGCRSVMGADGKPQLICETGQCLTDDTGGCISGMSNPSTHAEITLNQASVDYYDLSFVNGVNIPIGISPNNQPLPVEPYGQNPLFWCGKSGFKEGRGDFYAALLDSKNLIGCEWSFELPRTPMYQGYDSHVFYTLVSYTGFIECSSDKQCNPGDRCGFSPNDMATRQHAVPMCGKPIAYTVPANVCGTPYNQGAILPKQAFGCYSQPGALDAFKMQAYAMCALPPGAPPGITAPPTCYVGANNQPDPECCGCIAWEQTIPLTGNETCRVGDANNRTPNFWQANLRDKVEWLARQCPAGYSYQYDDVHSTFVCSSTKNPTIHNPNQLNYTVTFCPDGQTLFDQNDIDLSQFNL